MSAVLALERAVLDALRADDGVKAVLGALPRVFDSGVEAPAFPYMEIARHSVEEIGGAEAPLGRHELDLAVLTTAGGRDEAKDAAAAIRAVIEAGGLALDGYRCVMAIVSFVDVLRASRQQWRALVRVRAIVEPDV